MKFLRGASAAACAALLTAAALLPRTESMLLMLGALVAVCLLLAALVEPPLALAIALVAAPFQPLERVTLGLPIDSGQALLAAALFSYLLRWLVQARTGPIPRRASAAPLAAGAVFLGVGLLSFFAARDLADWLFECVKLAQLLLIALIVANERDPRRRALIIGALLASAFGQALLGVVQHHLLGYGPKEFLLPGTDRYRAYGTFEQPNPFGGYLGLLWPLAAGVALHAWRARRRGWAAAAFVVAGAAAYGLYVSGSRGALVGAGLAAAAMTAAWLPRPGRWAAAAVGAFALALAFGVVEVPASLEAQLAEYGDIDVRDAYLTPINFSTIERLAHWQAAIRMAEAHPWLGVGLGNYAAAYDEHRLIVWVNALGHAHNYYLNLLAETGLIGLAAYVIWWGAAAMRLWRARRGNFMAIGLLGALGHLAGHSAFDNLYVANTHLVLGVLLGLTIVVRDHVIDIDKDTAVVGAAPNRRRGVAAAAAAAAAVGAVAASSGAVHAQAIDPLESPAATPVVASVTSTVSVTATEAVTYEIGRSARGRPIVVHRFGDGPRARLLVGGIHGGYEANTVQLMSRTVEHLLATPQEVPADMTLYVVVNANPDGYASGTDRLRGRMNGAGVDLNRNWDFAWQRQAWHGMNPVSGGWAPFSEPETRALRDFIRERSVEAAIFYHSQMGAVFHGAGVTQTHSVALAQAVARATGYVHRPEGIPGQIMTGNSIDYLTVHEGVDAIEIELLTRFDIEWQRNLAGVRAFLRWEREAEGRRRQTTDGGRRTADGRYLRKFAAEMRMVGNL